MLGDRIKFFRELRGLTLEHLGVLLGFPQAQAHTRISKMETGERKPKEPTVQALAEIFEISPVAFADGTTTELTEWIGNFKRPGKMPHSVMTLLAHFVTSASCVTMMTVFPLS